MSEELKKLIEKIKQEGIQAAQEKASKIEAETRAKASLFLEKAKTEASEIISCAQVKVARMQENSELSLKQSARDTILALKKEVNSMLNRLIDARLKQSLTPEVTVKIILALIRNYKRREKADIRVLVNSRELAKLRNGLFNALSQELKEGVVLKGSEDIDSGFRISYDGGKSQFDFTDKAVSEYIGLYLKPKLAAILEAPATKEKSAKNK